MTIESAQAFLLWCVVINYGILLLWFLVFWFGHEWMFRLHSRWFHLAKERFDSIHYASMAAYKLGILLFNLTPYVALRLIGLHAS
jgi:hypothetical protein